MEAIEEQHRTLNATKPAEDALGPKFHPQAADRNRRYLAMASLGWYLIIFGAGSGLMSLFDYEFSLLMWIDIWGDGFAWLIRGAFILGGMALVSREQKLRQEQQPREAHNLPPGPVS